MKYDDDLGYSDWMLQNSAECESCGDVIGPDDDLHPDPEDEDLAFCAGCWAEREGGAA